MFDDEVLSILGGGIAALSAAYSAERAGLPYKVFGAESYWGAGAATLEDGKFLSDVNVQVISGRDRRFCQEIKATLGRDCIKLTPLQRFMKGGSALNLPEQLPKLLWRAGPLTLLSAGLEPALAGWLRRRGDTTSLRRQLAQQFGSVLSSRYLTSYFEKIWGLNIAEIDASIAGDYAWPFELNRWVQHTFTETAALQNGLLSSDPQYYPAFGVGEVADKLAERCNADRLVQNHPIQRIFHNETDIHGVEFLGGDRQSTDRVFATLNPLHILRLMEPSPPEEIMSLVRAQRLRSTLLVVLCVDMPRVSDAACTYFGDRDFPVTRLVESKNLSPFMAPPRQTALVAELPCFSTDRVWRQSDEQLEAWLCEQLQERGILDADAVLSSRVVRFSEHLPVPDAHYRERMESIDAYLKGIRNLTYLDPFDLSAYSAVESQMKAGHLVIEQWQRELAEARLMRL